MMHLVRVTNTISGRHDMSVCFDLPNNVTTSQLDSALSTEYGAAQNKPYSYSTMEAAFDSIANILCGSWYYLEPDISIIW